MFRLLLLAALGLVALPAAANAQPIAYEGFNYSTNQSINQANGGVGWGNAWNTNYTSQFFTFAGSTANPAGTLATSGNQLRTGNGSNTNFYDAGRSLSTNLNSGEGSSVWIGFTMRLVDPFATPSYGGLVIGNDVGSSATEGRLFIGDPGDGNLWSLQRAGGGTTGVSNFSVDFNAVHLVTNIVFHDNAPEDVFLYINPTLGGPAPAGNSAFLGNLDINPTNGPVTNVGLWFSGAIYHFDEIRIGGTYADVTPVPEPAALPIVAGLATFLAVLRSQTRGISNAR